MNDPIEWGKGVAALVKGYVDKAGLAIAQRMDDIERKLAAIPAGDKGDQGEPGRPGADGKDGAPGTDGKDAPPITVEQLIDALKAMPDVLGSAVKAYLVENPPPVGKDGRNGVDASPITDEQIAKSVASHLALNPPAAGRDGRDGLPGMKGADGSNGKDGANGIDGLGFDDLTVEDDGDGMATIKFTRGDVVKEFSLRLPRLVDKGIWRPENAYTKGDGLTFGGSFFIAQCDAPEGKPEDGNKSWRLAVKRGRDGKEGLPGKDFTPPKPVKL